MLFAGGGGGGGPAYRGLLKLFADGGGGGPHIRGGRAPGGGPRLFVDFFFVLSDLMLVASLSLS
jgi:hypothetical protein